MTKRRLKIKPAAGYEALKGKCSIFLEVQTFSELVDEVVHLIDVKKGVLFPADVEGDVEPVFVKVGIPSEAQGELQSGNALPKAILGMSDSEGVFFDFSIRIKSAV